MKTHKTQTGPAQATGQRKDTAASADGRDAAPGQLADRRQCMSAMRHFQALANCAPRAAQLRQRAASNIAAAAPQQTIPATRENAPQASLLQRQASPESEADIVGEKAALADSANNRPSAQPLRMPTIGSAAVQRKIVIHGVSVTKHNFKMVCESAKGKLYADWNELRPEEKERLRPIIFSDDAFPEAATFRAALTAEPVLPKSGADASYSASSGLPKTEEVELDGKTIRLNVLNDSGGYHIILAHPTNPNLVIRERRKGDEEGTSIREGMANLARLSRNLRQAVGRAVRTPHVEQASANGYIVERVDSALDGLTLWKQYKAMSLDDPRRPVVLAQLKAIAQLFQANINAMGSEEPSKFPDFRPANVGIKAGVDEIIYIDFDQRGEVADLSTILDHAMEWVGRRYPKDPGGTRAADPEFFDFMTGKLLGPMPGLQGQARSRDDDGSSSSSSYGSQLPSPYSASLLPPSSYGPSPSSHNPYVPSPSSLHLPAPYLSPYSASAPSFAAFDASSQIHSPQHYGASSSRSSYVPPPSFSSHSPSLSSHTSTSPPSSAHAMPFQDSLPQARYEAGLDGAGSLRVREQDVQVDISVNSTIYVRGMPKRIHYTSEYNGWWTIDFVDP